jgi:hypothetical protein
LIDEVLVLLEMLLVGEVVGALDVGRLRLTLELEIGDTEVGLEVVLLEVATGDATFALGVVDVYTVEKLEAVDEVVVAVVHLGCPTALPHPKTALAATAYGFWPLCAEAAALGRPCTDEIDVLREATPVEETTSTT